MATTLQERHTDRLPSGGGGSSFPAAGPGGRVADSSPASRTGVWVGLAAITMSFAAFTSAMIIRQGSAYDWKHFALPAVFYFDTAALMASSVVLEVARKRVIAYVHGARVLYSSAKLYLLLTLALGVVFLGGQSIGWMDLRAEGLYLATNPSSSFFYLFTVLHALHLVGGLIILGLATARFSRRQPTQRISNLNAVAYYWHFMAVLWIYLLLLLWWKI